MKKNKALLFASLLLLLLFTTGVNFASDLDVRDLETNGKVMKLSRVIEKINKVYPGRIIEVELQKENGILVYEIQIIDHQGVIWEISLNAKTGELLHKEKE